MVPYMFLSVVRRSISVPWSPCSPVIDGKKQCTKCKETKSVSEFTKHSKIKSGIRPTCKTCNNSRNRRYYIENQEKITAWQRAFNKTEHRKRYQRKWENARQRRLQDEAATRPRPFLCEGCGQPHRKIVYDHDHQTGLFRGWLCNGCNRGIGFFGDNPQVLRALANYLERAIALNQARKTSRALGR
jgi:hypothetical protein